MDTVRLLTAEDASVGLGAVAALERLARNPDIAETTVHFLRDVLKAWEKEGSAPSGDVKSAAQRLLATLEDEGRATDG